MEQIIMLMVSYQLQDFTKDVEVNIFEKKFMDLSLLLGFKVLREIIEGLTNEN